MALLFKPLQESHFPLLLKWLETPYVKAWWDKEIQWTPQLLEEKYGTYVQGYNLDQGVKKPLQAYVIYTDTRPIGYIQLYNPRDYLQEELLEDLSPSLAGLDFFIGEEDYLGRGLGLLILQQFLQEYVDPYYDACFVDPDKANIRAIRAYEKAGFKTVKTIQEGGIVWMIRKKNHDHRTQPPYSCR
jgi:RimJ/RimL family protein N-acetyltransferase